MYEHSVNCVNHYTFTLVNLIRSVPMAEASSPLTYDDVVQAARALASAGQKATSVAVRERLGRGSFSTIKKHLDRWRLDQEPMAVPSAPMPPQLESLWQEARREAERALAAERRDLQRLSEQLDSRWNELEAHVRATDVRCEHAEQRVVDKDTELARLAGQLDDLRSQRALAAAQCLALSQELARERDVAAPRLDALERRIGELTRVLGTLTEPLSTIPSQLSAVCDFVAAEFGRMRRDLSTRQDEDRAQLRELMAASQTLLASLAEQLTAHIQQQRRASHLSPSQCFPRRKIGRFWSAN